MVKKCPVCRQAFEGSGRKVYCGPKCRKAHEVSERHITSAPQRTTQARKPFSPVSPLPASIGEPISLNQKALAYWRKVAPTVLVRGHLNVLSEDAFLELCDLHSRLSDINRAIDETNRSLLQIDDKWDNVSGEEARSFKESALSDLKRKYSRQFLEYCKQFYLTPLSNRGNFNLAPTEERDALDVYLEGKNAE